MTDLLPPHIDFAVRTQQQSLEAATREQAVSIAQELLRQNAIQRQFILELMRKGL